MQRHRGVCLSVSRFFESRLRLQNTNNPIQPKISANDTAIAINSITDSNITHTQGKRRRSPPPPPRRSKRINPDKPRGQHRDAGSGFRKTRCDGEQTERERERERVGKVDGGGERTRVRKKGLETMEGIEMGSLALKG